MTEWMVKLYGDVYTLTHNQDFPVPNKDFFFDFKKVLDDDEGWNVSEDKNGTTVLFRDASNEETLQIKLRSTALKDIPAEVIHDVLQDPEYRATWDESMKEQKLVEQIDENTEIGYYSVKMPLTIANRDWVNMRSWWFDEKKGIYIITNHSVDHPKCGEVSGFVRAKSLKTGYIVEKTPEGTKLSFFSWNSWNGWIPNWVVNKCSKYMIADIIQQLRDAATKYPEWKKTHHPEERYWMKKGEVMVKSEKEE
ncbi:phosphatidylcholine transfer protein, putative [Entamoeba invadens IP1]|uniref:START domain-containing protein 10 n=1 Tax=Entamoeba invadens IP1 TaxID=370355 RepID=A0A0A1U213_ENTIV|nr:phosphatidylcholine transfer protein, putative [Entamoeba invadens IP1]ELP88101.1 phosphatidylcholine transfer protein, putative [Entamoeba invadens IP1]|eukprot:XP_004254872.1 phosphatidylcholine transfer protein, putative [Entamoeba invadens IP1]